MPLLQIAFFAMPFCLLSFSIYASFRTSILRYSFLRVASLRTAFLRYAFCVLPLRVMPF